MQWYHYFVQKNGYAGRRGQQQASKILWNFLENYIDETFESFL